MRSWRSAARNGISRIATPRKSPAASALPLLDRFVAPTAQTREAAPRSRTIASATASIVLGRRSAKSERSVAARASSRGEPKMCTARVIERHPLDPAIRRSALHAGDDGRSAFRTRATCAGGPLDMQRAAFARAVSADHDFVSLACGLGLTGDDSDDGTDPGRSRRSCSPHLALRPLRPYGPRESGVALGSWRPCRSHWALRSSRSRGAHFAFGSLRPRRSRRPLRSRRSRGAHFAFGSLRPRRSGRPLRSSRSLSFL